eukprot:GEMP01014604.1.p1 GENE.GEMP01014604.1~~GEMP01014604.1.p1  ORF type:complete len:524 (+),score=100.75 GEMP01014604.1:872-2443(+)
MYVKVDEAHNFFEGGKKGRGDGKEMVQTNVLLSTLQGKSVGKTLATDYLENFAAEDPSVAGTWLCQPDVFRCAFLENKFSTGLLQRFSFTFSKAHKLPFAKLGDIEPLNQALAMLLEDISRLYGHHSDMSGKLMVFGTAETDIYAGIYDFFECVECADPSDDDAVELFNLTSKHMFWTLSNAALSHIELSAATYRNAKALVRPTHRPINERLDDPRKRSNRNPLCICGEDVGPPVKCLRYTDVPKRFGGGGSTSLGRRYYRCVARECDFFQWADDEACCGVLEKPVSNLSDELLGNGYGRWEIGAESLFAATLIFKEQLRVAKVLDNESALLSGHPPAVKIRRHASTTVQPLPPLDPHDQDVRKLLQGLRGAKTVTLLIAKMAWKDKKNMTDPKWHELAVYMTSKHLGTINVLTRATAHTPAQPPQGAAHTSVQPPQGAATSAAQPPQDVAPSAAQQPEDAAPLADAPAEPPLKKRKGPRPGSHCSGGRRAVTFTFYSKFDMPVQATEYLDHIGVPVADLYAN